MKIYQLKDGYRYNSDSVFLYNFIKEFGVFGEVLDVGAGSGIVGFLLKRDFKNINLTCLEIQKQNLEILEKNSRQNGIDCDIICADFGEFKSEKRFDFIISNPPFYNGNIKQSENEHKKISRYASNLSLENLIKTANSHLKPQGCFIFCYDAKQIAEICVILKSFKLNLINLQFIFPNESKNANLAIFAAKKSSKSFCKILQPIFVNSGEFYTQKAQEIFKKTELESVDL